MENRNNRSLLTKHTAELSFVLEFLKYHVAEGVFYSQDLVDGQFLPSLLEGEYLQAGVRVDGCTRE